MIGAAYRSLRSRARATCLVLAAAAAACTARDTIADFAPGAPDNRDLYCRGSGPPVLLGGSCTGEIAEQLFRHSVCACDNLFFGDTLVTDAFDSRIAPWAEGGVGGDVASNAGAGGNREMHIAGNLVVSGNQGVFGEAVLDVSGDLDCGGTLNKPNSVITIEGSARIGGAVSVREMIVGGTLLTAPDIAPTGTITATNRQTAAVSVPPPCPCGDDVFDVGTVIAAHAAENHDAEIGLDPQALNQVVGDKTLDLPCGRFYLERIQGDTSGTVTVHAQGRTALFIGRDVILRQDLVLTVDPDAELDVFIGGTVQVSGALRIGDPTMPRSLRVYVGAGGSLALAGPTVVAGNLYAPRADLASSAALEVYGALVVNRITGAAPVTLHYDRAVAYASKGCLD